MTLAEPLGGMLEFFFGGGGAADGARCEESREEGPSRERHTHREG